MRTIYDAYGDGYGFEEPDDPRTLTGELIPDCRVGEEENDEDVLHEPEEAHEEDE